MVLNVKQINDTAYTAANVIPLSSDACSILNSLKFESD